MLDLAVHLYVTYDVQPVSVVNFQSLQTSIHWFVVAVRHSERMHCSLM